jgi:hypothetical protein
MHPYPVDVDKLPWELARDFNHEELLALLQPTGGHAGEEVHAPLVGATSNPYGSTGADKY